MTKDQADRAVGLEAGGVFSSPEDARGPAAGLRQEITDAMDAARTMSGERDIDGLLRLVGDPEWPEADIKRRLNKARSEQDRLRRKVAKLEGPDIDGGVVLMRTLLELLSRPRDLYA